MNFKKATIKESTKNASFIEEKSFASILIATFSTVFIAEIGDKTQLATLLLSAQSGQPLVVFTGAAIALIASSLIGVLVGQWLSSILPAEKFEQLAGVMMIFLSGWLVFQVSHSYFSS